MQLLLRPSPYLPSGRRTICGGQMRIIAFITHSTDIRQTLDHIGVESESPHIASARGSPLWEDCDAQVGEGPQLGAAIRWLRVLTLYRPGALGSHKPVQYLIACS
jgi:hypothetical protein